MTLRSYNPSTREWFIDEGATGRMRRWLDYCRANLYAEVEWLDGEAYDPEAEWTPPKKARPQAFDPYQILHLRKTAPPELIRAAFKCLATLHHPDKPGGDTEAMQRINDAYGRLAT